MQQLFDYQEAAISLLKTGSILCGGVGSGKTLTSLSFYDRNYKDWSLIVITTAKKRDSKDWEREASNFELVKGEKFIVDSWNNIHKYVDVEQTFFIFDEQRLVGSGSWTKSFYKIAKKNPWILLSATPGDTWQDYIPVFIANGFYKNRTDFLRQHVVFNTFVKFPKVDRYVDEGRLIRNKERLLVRMEYKRKTSVVIRLITVAYDKRLYKQVEDRWNPWEDKPIRDISQYCYLLRKVVNSDSSRIAALRSILDQHRRIIVFYSFDYELELLRSFRTHTDFLFAEYNGHKHEDLPEGESWVYAVQYASGSEGWNCITGNTVVFFSYSYSYKSVVQAAGRVDRVNTPFQSLFYYFLRSDSSIDKAIARSLANKKDFNEKEFSR